jgi:RNA polymerase sigma factor (sigma-70 family)
MDVATTHQDPAQLSELLVSLWERTGDRGIGRLVEGRDPAVGDPLPADAGIRRDWISTALMDCYKRSGDQQVFAAIYDLNRSSFLAAIRSKLRRTVSNVDPHDALQEVFLNIYRYPHRFLPDRADAFRNWGHRIVQNTVLKFLKREAKRTSRTVLQDEIDDRIDVKARSPERSVTEAESARLVDKAYLLYLTLYLAHFQRLSDRERRALTMVECEGISYRDTAATLGIRLENLKMVIFRGRRKILRGMTRSLSELDQLGAPAPRTERRAG